MATSEHTPSHFLREIIRKDVEAGTYGGRVGTRFPPEPNGYPHLGHAKSICLNFGMAEEFGGTCNLRFDDTNPETESPEYVAALEDAVRWLGFTPHKVVYASDYFEQFYEWAILLIKKGLAYVDDQSEEQIRATRGTVTQAGTNSPYRDRSVEENLQLLEEMKDGLHPDGSRVLRAKIDMAHPNMKLRDPLMYRIRRDAHHYRRGNDWKIYPLYDWAHGQGDAIEDITHSFCTLEFDVNRPLYDWFLDAIGIAEPRNHQYEFARLNLEYTMMSKRRLLRLVEDGHVTGWDDPRMPTIAAQKRRGVRPEAIRAFCDTIGVSNVDGRVELSQFEYAIRNDLNHVAPRVMAVSRPLKLVITNLPENKTTWVDAPYWPHDVTPPADATLSRRLPLTREIWIEKDDFAEIPPKGWKRLAPDTEIRLRHGYVIRCVDVIKDDAGKIVELHAEADLKTLGAEPEGRKVRGVIHWVSADHAISALFRLYDRLFTDPAPDALEDYLSALNPNSLVETRGFIEPSIVEDDADARYQFERLGYFRQDPVDSSSENLVFNRIVSLRDSWGKVVETSVQQKAPKVETKISTSRDLTAGLSDEQKKAFDGFLGQGIGQEEAAVLAKENVLSDILTSLVSAGHEPADAAVLIIQDLRPALGSTDPSTIPTEELGNVLSFLNNETITRAGAREIVQTLVNDGGTAQQILDSRGLAVVRDESAFRIVIESVLADHPEEVARYRDGDKRLIGFLMGQTMRRLGKGADAAAVKDVLAEMLD